MIAVVLLVMVAVLALVVGAHWYVWRRVVRDTTEGPGPARRIGTVAVIVLPVLSVGAVLSSRAEAPFWLQRLIAWPGYMWMAVLLYLVMALLVGEAVRAIWLRSDRKSAAPGTAEAVPVPGTATVTPATAPAMASPAADPSVPPPADSSVPPAGDASVPPAADLSVPPAGDTPAGLLETKPAPEPSAAVSRRLFVSRVVGAGAAVAAVGIVGNGTRGVLNGPTLKRVTVTLDKLPRSAHGFKIALVGDIHLGSFLSRSHTQRVVDTINAARPDLIGMVGDLVDGDVSQLGPEAEPLAQLRAPHGSFYVVGNHEYYSHAGEWVDRVRELGLTPLENERVEIAAGFDLVGVNDVQGESVGHGPDFAKALRGRDRSRASVLLAHQPILVHDADEHGIDLQLSGHTHGGQLWPGNYVAELANPTVYGLERHGDTQLYVTRGAGAWGPPVRVGAESDVTIVQLASRQP
ncbi:metallophosphoesterase [Streptomyces sp. NPDC000594]|uniref:metallophosphoesterase n=1 Tax=Streptomyces sp. NPDC000594 TaxID=3154261 RepID=UPI003331FEA6